MGQPLSETGKELSVSRAGTYRVIVTNEGGCTASAEVIIRESQTELPIDIYSSKFCRPRSRDPCS